MKINNISVDNKQQIQNYYFPSDLEGAWLENVIKEIWEDNEYERFGIKIKPGDIVLDLGANVGVFSLYALSKKAHQIYAFEKNEQEYECLILNTIKSSNITNIKGLISNNDYNFTKIFQEFNLGRVDFCKIDIEGYEYDLLLNANSEDIKKINQFSVEIHDIYSHHEIYRILEMFSKNNFSINFEIIHTPSTLAMIYAKNKSI
tara:strand:+ start:1718 stop:2326 length:609 start_codon:yes stop_codon:yes gene_type:complete